ncbi:MAG: transcriptional repressor [Clostridiales bacterium]|nr:transcriptional repressor [Clostridiales bacterium]
MKTILIFEKEVYMTDKKGYKTKHQGELIDYLKTIPGKHVTAGEICSCMKANGSTIGTATVYRQLEKLVSEGTINKYIVDEGSSACYEFVPDGEHCKAENCYHLKCSSCGKLIHMECDEVAQLTCHIKEHHGFKVDPKRTVFYGICSDCEAGEV